MREARRLAVARAILLYADGTLDYDGQWNVRAGIGFGGLGYPARWHRSAPVNHNVQVNIAPQSSAIVNIHSDGDAHVAVDAQPGSQVEVNVNAAGSVDVTPTGPIDIYSDSDSEQKN